MPGLLKGVECIELYVSDLNDGIKYYCENLELKLLWRSGASAGLGMEDGVTEIVLQTERMKMSIDFKVDSVWNTIRRVIKTGGKIIQGPFEIPVGKCAVIQDKWGNEYAIVDMSKGRYVTDGLGNVIGVSKSQ